MSETDQQTALDGIPSSLDDMASGDTPLSDVFPEEFVQKYTEAASIDALLDQRSWSASTFGDLDSIPLAELDDLDIEARSLFGSTGGVLWIHRGERTFS
jgi:hypothetical protein